ncbi:outer membrane beta-barrel protein [Mucilaginibacter sp. BJC16-A38]|uniref:outer membrane beta-barrel family protein n=1 Tax=Mucilaginibacter phenanthrenivorans TaxID=1234842 RepID=UPI0021572234|nr:outer membrane beta-barrel family protein [Mucilaginibacter phenanthrenivorans]MCR8559314.1 outer membrane beta-barrel protein [Mucilaginibacter phenanthrenivorans]
MRRILQFTAIFAIIAFFTFASSARAITNCRAVAVFPIQTGKNGDTTAKPTTHPDTGKLKTKVLKEVTVNGKRVLIIQHVDRAVIKVENNDVFKGSNLEEVLEKVPGISFDGNNNLMINGSRSVKIQINGKDVIFDSSSIPALLKSIQSASIKDIEIINPSAKQDAQSSNKILNINTVHSTTNGYSFSSGASYSQGHYPQYGLNLFAQAKINKLSLQFFSFANRSNEYSTSNSTIDYFNQGGTLSNNGHSLNDKKSLFNKFDLTYNLDSKTSLGLSAGGNMLRAGDNGTSLYQFQKSGQTDSTSRNTNASRVDFSYFVYNFYVKRSLDSSGQALDFNLDFNRATNTKGDYYDNVITSESVAAPVPLSQEILNSTKRSTISIPAVRIDYTKPFAKNNGKIEAGIKYAHLTDDESNEFLNSPASSFRYKEDIFAQYISVLYEKGLSGIQAGLRGENTNDDEMVNSSQSARKNYYELFPSISLQQKISKDKDMTVSLNYRRRIQRPNFLALSPFIYYTSPYEAFRGDQGIKPTTYDDFSTSISWKALYVNFAYSILNNGISSVPLLVDSGQTVLNQYVNIDRQVYKSLNISYRFTIRNINFDPNISTEFSSYKTIINNQAVEKNITNFVANLSAYYKINDNSRVEMRSFYEPHVQTLSSTLNHKESVTLRYIRTMYKGRLSLRITAEDIFNTNKESGTYQLLNYNGRFSNFFDNRKIGVSLTYSIKKGQKAALHNNSQGNSENSDRINN